MLRTFLVEDEVIIRENIKRMVPWEKYGFELVGGGCGRRDGASSDSEKPPGYFNY